MRYTDKHRTKKFYPRTGRYFYADGFWYAQTREKIFIGPFTSKDRARRELHYFVRNKKIMAA